MGLESVVCMHEWNAPSVRAKYGYDFSGIINRVAQENSGTRTKNWMKALLRQKGFIRVN